MDSSMARHQIQIEAIKNALPNGTMSIRHIRDILLREIEQELDKPSEEVSMAYVNACQDFLTRLESSRANAKTSHYNENLAAIHVRMGIRNQLLYGISILRPITAVCLVLVVFFGGLLFPSDRIVTSQSPDNEHYLVQGMEDPIGNMINANANDMQIQFGSCVTTDWSDIVSLFGYAPRIPHWLPDGWDTDTYKANFSEAFSRLSVTYVNQNSDRYLVFDAICFYDIDTLYAVIEQNSIGVQTLISDRHSVYITSNVDDAVAVWYDGHMQYILTGPISSDDLIHCIESIDSSE